MNSTNRGVTWSPNIRLTYAIRNSLHPALAVSQNYTHLVFKDNRLVNSSHGYEIFYKRYPDFPTSTYNITLTKGWNLVSLPLEQKNGSIDAALSSIAGKYDRILLYDPKNASDHWRQYCSFWPPGMDQANALDDKAGFWLNMTENATLTVTGYLPEPTSISLRAGWNLVGYPTLCSNKTVANAFWGSGVDRVEVFDPYATYKTRVVGPTYVMQPGQGYWVHAAADSIWTINW